jgi:shikimate kinase
MMNDTRIVIVGFMGCGKTEVARELALMRNVGWADLDALIEEEEGRSPAQIIIENGETVFREKETGALRKLLTSDGEQVIAMGGGAWTIPDNRALVREHNAVTVWLDAPFDLCWQRIEAADQARPLAPTRDAALKLYSQRGPIYSLAALRITVANESPAAIAERIAALLLQQSHT